jgi:hypothetical protein
MTEETEENGGGLQVRGYVTDVPPPQPPRRSRWDPIIDMAVLRPNEWVQIDKPSTFSSSTISFVRKRREHLEVAERGNSVYIRYAPPADTET